MHTSVRRIQSPLTEGRHLTLHISLSDIHTRHVGFQRLN